MEDRELQAIDAAKLYYLGNYSQSEVAERMGVSRPTVSKLLSLAKETGYVRIEIEDPRESGSEIGRMLAEKYHLVDVAVTPVRADNREEILPALGRLGAEKLQELVKDNFVVGVSWGNTLYSMARHLKAQNLHGVEVVQLKGGLSHSDKTTNDFETIDLFCRSLNAKARLLPLPAVFRSAEVKRLVEDEPFISNVMDHARHADVVVFTVGSARPESTLFKMGYFTEKDKEKIVATAVGDICSRWINTDGEICVPDVDQRTVGISLDQLKDRPVRLMVAGGVEKAQVIEVALRCGYATHLVIDQATALKVLGLEQL